MGFLHAIESMMLPVLDLPTVQKCALGLDLDQGISMPELDWWTRAVDTYGGMRSCDGRSKLRSRSE
jgi:hypothetical protein